MQKRIRTSLIPTDLQVKDEQHEELKQVRVYIHSSFEEVKCFLMPHPGFVVSTSQDFHGEIRGGV